MWYYRTFLERGVVVADSVNSFISGLSEPAVQNDRGSDYLSNIACDWMLLRIDVHAGLIAKYERKGIAMQASKLDSLSIAGGGT